MKRAGVERLPPIFAGYARAFPPPNDWPPRCRDECRAIAAPRSFIHCEGGLFQI